MSSFVFDCPNCSAKKSTFDVKGYERRNFHNDRLHFWYLFGTCRFCKTSMSFNADFKMDSLYNLKQKNHQVVSLVISEITEILKSPTDLSTWFDRFQYTPILPATETPPEYLPSEVEIIFKEAAKCFSIGCYNAAGAMFRLCLDITTKQILDNHLNKNPTANDKKTIHSRLKWIFENEILPSDLEDLSRGIKDDGNDAAHDGSLNKDDAEDLLDFTYILLERVYTEPERVKIAAQRRVARRQTP